MRELRELPVDAIDPNASQPRQRFDEAALQALASSIRERGVLQPVLVRPRTGGGYQIVAGERRWLAAQIAGLEKIPALVCEYDDAATLEVALIENMAREDLGPLEEARACETLVQLGLTHRQIGDRVGRSISAVANLRRLLNLSGEILDFIERGELGIAHGLALLVAKDAKTRGELASKAVTEGWTVRAIEARARESDGDAAGLDKQAPRRRGSKGVGPERYLDETGLAVVRAWRELGGAEVGVRPMAHGRVRVELQFDSPQAALEAAARPAERDFGHGGHVAALPTSSDVLQQDIERARMIAWTTALGAITVEALSERDELGAATARERLDEAVGLGLLEKHSLLVGYPDLYTATGAGRRLARKHADAGGYSYPEGLRTAGVTIKDARHTIACVSVVATLERRYPGHRVIGERELHRDERTQECRLASVEIRRHGRTRSHHPDIVIWPPSGAGGPPPLPIAVEVELTMKSREELTAICLAYARSRHIEGALYYAETTKIEERLLETIERVRAEQMVVVNPLSAIVKSLPGFELSPWEADE